MQPNTNVFGAPFLTAKACITIISIVAGIVLLWPCATIASESPTTQTSAPAASAQLADV